MGRIRKLLIVTCFSIFISGCATGPPVEYTAQWKFKKARMVTHGGAFKNMVSSLPKDIFHGCVKNYMLANFSGDMHSNSYCGTDEGNPVIPVRKALDSCGQDLSPSEKHQFVKNCFDAYSLSCRWIESLPSPPLETFQEGNNSTWE